MASARGKGKDGRVTNDDLRAVEYELLRTKTMEQNEIQLALVRQKSHALSQEIEASRPPKQRKKVCFF
jgi:hypothetical protein